MARHKRKRIVESMPVINAVSTYGGASAHLDSLTIDEYEALRLIDFVGLTQSETAEKMGVARTTVQAIYSKARFKVSRLLVEGGIMKVEGGDYCLGDKG